MAGPDQLQGVSAARHRIDWRSFTPSMHSVATCRPRPVRKSLRLCTCPEGSRKDAGAANALLGIAGRGRLIILVVYGLAAKQSFDFLPIEVAHHKGAGHATQEQLQHHAAGAGIQIGVSRTINS